MQKPNKDNLIIISEEQLRHIAEAAALAATTSATKKAVEVVNGNGKPHWLNRWGPHILIIAAMLLGWLFKDYVFGASQGSITDLKGRVTKIEDSFDKYKDDEISRRKETNERLTTVETRMESMYDYIREQFTDLKKMVRNR